MVTRAGCARDRPRPIAVTSSFGARDHVCRTALLRFRRAVVTTKPTTIATDRPAPLVSRVEDAVAADCAAAHSLSLVLAGLAGVRAALEGLRGVRSPTAAPTGTTGPCTAEGGRVAAGVAAGVAALRVLDARVAELVALSPVAGRCAKIMAGLGFSLFLLIKPGDR